MNLRHAIVGAALLVGVGAIYPALAASGGLWNTLPTVPNSAGLTGTELVPADTQLPNGANPQTEYIGATQLRAVQYSQQTPVTAFAIVVPQGVGLLQLTPAGTLATGTITFPPNAVDGQQFCIFDTQTQTAVTLSPATGQTINGTALTALTANTRYCYVYAGSTTNAGTANAWYRAQ